MESDDRFHSPKVAGRWVLDLDGYHEVLPSSANDEVRFNCRFADDGNASRYSVCRVPMME